ncbi:glycosyltransferase [Chryseobacterium sp. SNU WT5]|uniref:glycosyltransferase n=1 Tax=Chryseobacterium sp. SNU WT5 TaxID=2594269 RepID=UPI001180528C|nr:glycosyltransferase [Chryseobacterium sp. SNU WT5]QDP85841.1 glycosyltransferase [Chryseobacterium sp. SNU WT5]
MKVVQISIEVNSGSVGRIAEQIGEKIIENGGESYITFARNNLPSKSKVIQIGSMVDVYYHVLKTRIFDNHALESKSATKKLIKQIEEINPDIIHLHHLHGYFINIKILFDFLKKINKPVVWTFHDCWSFTGHCAHYEYVACNKWETECFKCPQKNQYPKSLLIDRSRKNFQQKNKIFNSLENMTVVPVSNWLEGEVKKSFLKDHNICTIQNGIDLKSFVPLPTREKIVKKYNLKNQKIILGVASTWDERKGLDYFIQLSEKLNKDEFQIILVGLSGQQIKKLPKIIVGIMRTESVKELAELYSAADVFVNPTLEDTFPTTNLEALACGTPVVTFNTGGSPEALSKETGLIVEKGNTDELIVAIKKITTKNKSEYMMNCRKRVEKYFNKDIQFMEYLKLYAQLLSNKN